MPTDPSPPARRRDPSPAAAGRHLGHWLIGVITGRRSKLISLAIGLIAAVALIGLGGETAPNGGPGAGLPSGSDSARAAQLQAELPSSGQQPAIVVFTRTDGERLGDRDRPAIDDARERITDLAVDGEVGDPTFAPDDDAALLTVPLDEGEGNAEGGASDELARTVEELRTRVEADLPGGLRAEVTGPAAFRVDLSNVFAGADTRLLLVTALVVAILLLLTYRSPWLWLVPLTVIALADRAVASMLAILSREAGLIADGSTGGIVSVLVFGAGTNYALLLVARYREELRAHEDRHDAMRVAIGRAAPAILASSSTVILALITLAFAELPFSRNIGLTGALGILTALIFALGVLPPALLLFGRKLFWPVVPRYGTENPALSGGWSRIGRAVTERPALVSVGTLALLVVLALGCLRIDVGLSQTEQLRDRPDSVVGQERITDAFGPGFGEPVTIVGRSGKVEGIVATVRDVDGVLDARPGPADDDWAQVTARLEAASGSDAALRTVERLRDRLDDGPGQAVVGGLDAQELDKQAAAASDQWLIVPLVLAVVLIVLLMLLRSVVAAVVLSLTNVLSWAAALGAATLAYEHVFGFPGIDVPVPLLSFLFLIALGVDYNMFLITRAREEAATKPTREAIVAALASTGGVITSAGIVLAAVFAVLGVLPLITLTQVGIVVGLGILIDTLIVRTILVPALVTLIGPRFWWPSHPGTAGPEDATPTGS